MIGWIVNFGVYFKCWSFHFLLFLIDPIKLWLFPFCAFKFGVTSGSIHFFLFPVNVHFVAKPSLKCNFRLTWVLVGQGFLSPLWHSNWLCWNMFVLQSSSPWLLTKIFLYPNVCVFRWCLIAAAAVVALAVTSHVT